MITGLHKAIELSGGMTALAVSLETTKGVVFQWKQRGQVPAEYCPRIERLHNGAVRCEELNDKIDWTYLRTSLNAGPRRHGRR